MEGRQFGEGCDPVSMPLEHPGITATDNMINRLDIPDSNPEKVCAEMKTRRTVKEEKKTELKCIKRTSWGEREGKKGKRLRVPSRKNKGKSHSFSLCEEVKR
ncbi:hypothetical protein CEXT_188661 [Caerostris extrusa]|uniref:Uncharacterized protein n=1 Tax=Caerostris extrusa TaxID=172846 RepID=A0AAV4RA27_CAEEX|nr:hypothetical protein CEXT_188661 [Caerostris extrusa]